MLLSPRIRASLESIKAHLLTLCFPFTCELCQAGATRPVCEACLARLKETSSCCRCGQELNQLGCPKCSLEFQASGFKTLGVYQSLRSLILKEKSRPAANSLDRLSILPWDTLVPNQFFVESTDLVFVPSRRSQHWIFDQMRTCQESPTSGSTWQFIAPPFIRNPGKMSQKFLNREARIVNPLNLFLEVDDFRRISEQALLVDDVLSTGASLKTCISTLRKLGYKRVYVFVLAYQERETRRIEYGSGEL